MERTFNFIGQQVSVFQADEEDGPNHGVMPEDVQLSLHADKKSASNNKVIKAPSEDHKIIEKGQGIAERRDRMLNNVQSVRQDANQSVTQNKAANDESVINIDSTLRDRKTLDKSVKKAQKTEKCSKNCCIIF